MKSLIHNTHMVRRMRKYITKGEVLNFTNQPRNVVTESGSGEGIALNGEEKYIFVPLITELAMKYPQYTFFVIGSHNSANRLAGVTVFAGEEAIGQIRTGEPYSNTHYGVMLGNERIEADMTRGTAKKTTNLKTAVKLFGRYFYPLTMNEIMEQSANELISAVNNALWGLKQKRGDAQRSVQDFLRARLNSRDPALMQFLNTEGKADLVDDWDKQASEVAIMSTLQSKLGKEGQYIQITDDGYNVLRKGKSSVLDGAKRCKREDMSDSMRTALALLKLSEPNTCLEGAGYKLDDTNYFIYDEVQLEFDD